jgi:hypothetical protein
MIFQIELFIPLSSPSLKETVNEFVFLPMLKNKLGVIACIVLRDCTMGCLVEYLSSLVLPLDS